MSAARFAFCEQGSLSEDHHLLGRDGILLVKSGNDISLEQWPAQWEGFEVGMAGERESHQPPCEALKGRVQKQRAWSGVTGRDHKINKTGLKQGCCQCSHGKFCLAPLLTNKQNLMLSEKPACWGAPLHVLMQLINIMS